MPLSSHYIPQRIAAFPRLHSPYPNRLTNPFPRPPHAPRPPGAQSRNALRVPTADNRAGPMRIHAHPLHSPQLLQPVHGDNGAEDRAPGADAPETNVGLFDEVLQVHAVEGGDEGAGRDGEGEDGEFQVQKHEGVAVGVEDGFDAALVLAFC